MLDSAVDGILVVDLETKCFVFANNATCEMLGYTGAEIRHLTLQDIHPPEVLPAAQHHFEQVLKAKTRVTADHKVQRKDGSTFYATTSISLMMSGGRPYAVGFFHDITGLKRSADALAHREGLLHAVMQGTSYLVSAEISDGGIHEALRVVGEALDVDRVVVVEEQANGPVVEAAWERADIPISLAGVDLASLPVDFGEIWREPLHSGRAVVSHRDSVSPEVGQVFDAVQARSILLIPVFAGGAYRGAIGLNSCREKRDWSASDIDVVATFATLLGSMVARNDSRRSLERSEERFRAVSETARDAILMVDPSGRIRYWNPAAERLLGYSAEEAAGMGPVVDWLVPTRLRQEATDLVTELGANGRHAWVDEIVERPVLARDGSELPVELSFAPLALSGERLTVAILHDVTQRRKTEAALIASEAQLSNALKMARAGDWSYDVARDEFTFNDNFYAIFRTTVAEVGGYAMRSADYAARFCHPDDAAVVGQEIAAAIATTDPRYSSELEHRVVFSDGQLGWIAVRFFIVKDEGGKTISWHGVNQDITERKLHEEALRRLNRTLRTLSSTNHALVHASDEKQLCGEVCRILVEIGGYAMASVGLCEPPDRVLPVAYAGKVAQDYIESAGISFADTERGRGPTGTAIRTGETQINRSFADNPSVAPWRAAAQSRGFRSSIALPLKENERVIGALSIYATELDVFNSDEVRLLEELAADTSFGISALRDRRARVAARQRLRHGLEVTVEALASTVELRDAYTAGHQRRVSKIATAMARRMGLPEDAINGLRLASIIHDVGKIQVPAEILSKPGRLSPLEFALIKEHAQAGYDIVKDIDFPWPVAEIILQHHERLDGSGYPRGLKADQILIEAKILGVADVIEAMTSHRPYRAALGTDAALAEIEAGKGKLYDPAAVDACANLFQEGFFSGEAKSLESENL